MNRQLLIGGAAAVALVAVAVAVMALTRDRGGDVLAEVPTSATSTTAASAPAALADLPAPDPADARADLAHLAGAGALLHDIHREARVVTDTGALDSRRCSALRDKLEQSAGTDELLVALAGLRDPVLRDAMSSEQRALLVVATACDPDAYRPEGGSFLDDLVGLVDARLGQLERAA